MSGFLLCLFVGLLAVVTIGRSAVSALSSPLRNVPGPIAARFSRLWYFASIWKGQAHQDNIALHRQHAPPGRCYAPVVRLGPNMYSIAQPDKTVYGIAAKMTKSAWYEGWKHPSPSRWTLFSDRDMARHAETRRRFQSMYALSSLLHYEPLVDAVQDVFRRRLDELAAAPATAEPIDMHHWLQCYAFDVVGMITFGRRFGFLDEGTDVEGCLASLKAALPFSTLVGVYSWTYPFLYKLMEWLPGSGAAGKSYIISFVDKRIRERQAQRAAAAKVEKHAHDAPGSSARDFLDIALDAQMDPEKAMTQYNVVMMANSNIVAGSDTTAISLSSILIHLCLNPAALTRLRAELDRAHAEVGPPPDRDDCNLPFKTAQALPYLQACIKEALRLWPATGLPLWRVVPAGGAQIMGRFFPAGTEVGINTWIAHRDEDVWGPDAQRFRPERWLVDDDSEKGETSTQHQPRFQLRRDSALDANFMPFGLGARTCIGRHISLLELAKLVPMIVCRFDLDLVRPERARDAENFWFCRPTDFHVRLRRRRAAQ